MVGINKKDLLFFLEVDKSWLNESLFEYENIILDSNSKEIFSINFPDNILNKNWKINNTELSKIILKKVCDFSDIKDNWKKENIFLKKLFSITRKFKDNKQIYLNWIISLVSKENEAQENFKKSKYSNNTMKLLIKLFYWFTDQISWKKIIELNKNSFTLNLTLSNAEAHHINSRENIWYFDCLPYNLICIKTINHNLIHREDKKLDIFIDIEKKKIFYKDYEKNKETDYIPIKIQPPKEFFNVLNKNIESYPNIKK